MKKSISKSKVQRMRNLITKKYGDKTKIQTGYLKTKKKHSEGDVWEEKGKTWTIKNGIKQNVTKLDSIREAIRVPLCCPKCSKSMTHWLNDIVWPHFKMCYKCVKEFEKDLRREQGWDKKKWEEYQNGIRKANFDYWLEDIKGQYEDWLDKRNSKKYITERGDIEDWSSGQSNETLKKSFDKDIKKLEKRAKKVLKGE